MTGKKIIFSFDEESYRNLLDLQSRLGAESIAETVRKSLAMMTVLGREASAGYSEIVLRNHAEKQEKTVTTPLVKPAGVGW